MSQDKALIPSEQREIDFYGDELIVVLLDGQPYIPIAPICDFLGVSWSGQSERIRRDAVLSEEALSLRVTRKESQRGGREMVCLPLEYLNGWLFRINANRVRDELRERLIRYQKDCYRVLAQAFQGPATAPPSSSLAQIREMALAIASMAEQQMLLEGRVTVTEARLDKAAIVVGTISQRLGRLESRLQPGSHITEEQAAEISQKVKALASLLQEQSPGRNFYQSIFGELYRRYNVTSYKLIRQSQYPEVLAFLDEWRERALQDEEEE
jgi:hypothetical protein